MTQHEVKGANEKGHISFQNLWTFFQRAELLKKKKKKKTPKISREK